MIVKGFLSTNQIRDCEKGCVKLLVKSFPRGGGHIPPRKDATKNKPIMVMPAPKLAVIALSQHAGAPCKPLVQVGDRVKLGQKIGDAEPYISAPVHASVSGQVVEIAEKTLLDGTKALCVVIENDGLDETEEQAAQDYSRLSPSQIAGLIREAGIVGLGGAGFPTHVKTEPRKPVDTVLINGAECEPYLTCDHRLMIEQPQKLIEGLKILMQAVGAGQGIIGVELNKPDAIRVLEQVCAEQSYIRVVGLKVKYPQGAEKQLIKAALGREVPSGGLPADVGCIVQNVQTAVAVADAVVRGVGLYQRVITVAGAAVYDPRNVLVRVGTPIQEVIDYCGGMANPAAIVAGGPMTGKLIQDLTAPVTKPLSGILVLSKDEVDYELNLPCIRCARCVDHCPMGLQPNYLADWSSKGLYDQAKRNHIMDCIECGLCSYVCPAKRGLCRSIQAGKQAVRAGKTAV
ncbi:MAG TPA: electron transport complex subunit RsxC [Limnochordia bacterium]|nr:electron transport complex subunit RsxC [Limnochordia bacterium]